MNTADEMITYVLESGFGVITKKDVKNFVLIEETLQEDEVVIMAFAGLHNFVNITTHNLAYAFAITNKRLIMAQKRAFNANVQSVLLEYLTNITFNTGVTYGTIIFSTLDDIFNVGLEKNQAKNLNEVIQFVMMELKNNSDTTENVDVVHGATPMDEIKELKELLDLGAITEKEYDEKKQELLARV